VWDSQIQLLSRVLVKDEIKSLHYFFANLEKLSDYRNKIISLDTDRINEEAQILPNQHVRWLPVSVKYFPKMEEQLISYRETMKLILGNGSPLRTKSNIIINPDPIYF